MSSFITRHCHPVLWPAWGRLLQSLLFVAVFWLLATGAYADLPAAPGGAGGAGNSDYIATFKTYAGQTVALIILIIGAVIFIVVAWLAVQALIEAVSGRGTWAQVILLGVIGSGVLVFDLVLLNAATGVFGVAANGA